MILFDHSYTVRWDQPLITELSECMNRSSRQFCALRKEQYGDIGWITTSHTAHEILSSWLSAHEAKGKHVTPITREDLYTHDFQYILSRIIDEVKRDTIALSVFPAEMIQETSDDFNQVLDSIDQPDDLANIPIGVPTDEQITQTEILEELPLPGFPKTESERRKAWSKLP